MVHAETQTPRTWIEAQFISLIRGKSFKAISNHYLWPMRSRDICSDRKLFYKIGCRGKSPYILLRRQYASKWDNLEPGLKPYLHGDHSGFNALTMTEISNELKNAFAHLGTNTAKLILPWYNCSKISAQFRSCTQRVFNCTYLYLLLRTRKFLILMVQICRVKLILCPK